MGLALGAARAIGQPILRTNGALTVAWKLPYASKQRPRLRPTESQDRAHKRASAKIGIEIEKFDERRSCVVTVEIGATNFAWRANSSHRAGKRSPSSAQREQSLPKRPIAPGNGWSPLPPWDPAFPGAFFFAALKLQVQAEMGPMQSISPAEIAVLAGPTKREVP